MGLYRIGAVEVGPGARTAANGFVILIILVAEGEIVHRPLGRRHHAQGAVKGVGHALRGFDVAGDDGRRIAWVEHRTLGNGDVQGLQAAAVERDVFIDEGAEDIKHRRPANGGRGIEIVPGLLRRAGEVDLGAAGLLLDRNLDLYLGAVVHIGGERTGLEHVEHPAHGFLGVVLDMAHVGPNHVEAEVADHLAELPNAFFVGGDLGLHVGQVLFRVAGRIGAFGQQRQKFLFP